VIKAGVSFKPGRKRASEAAIHQPWPTLASLNPLGRGPGVLSLLPRAVKECSVIFVIIREHKNTLGSLLEGGGGTCSGPQGTHKFVGKTTHNPTWGCE
jgi:hypothetical protein